MSEERNPSGTGQKAVDPAFWRELWNQARLVYYLMRDPEVPFYLKLLPLAAIAYVIFPADLAPDLVPVLGQMDDLMALLVGAKVFVEMAPPHVVERYQHSFEAREEDPLKDAIIVDAEHEPVTEDERRKMGR
ncbi:MAG: DUF1232 domain-containing protein [Anaerolineae bacterium]|nr:DUF1232 domain-containing protein [Anaerolineae bacterium]